MFPKRSKLQWHPRNPIFTMVIHQQSRSVGGVSPQHSSGDQRFKLLDATQNRHFINTAGIGIIEHAQIIAPQKVQPGDVLLLNGDIGRHGIAIMAVRAGLEFETRSPAILLPLLI